MELRTLQIHHLVTKSMTTAAILEREGITKYKGQLIIPDDKSAFIFWVKGRPCYSMDEAKRWIDHHPNGFVTQKFKK